MTSSQAVAEVVLVGPPGGGKSCLVNRILGRYPIEIINKPDTISTYANFAVRDMRIKNKMYKLDLCDTHGDPENFHLQYRSAKAILLVFDLTSRDSFHEITATYEKVRTFTACSGQKDSQFILIGNKCDLDLDRLVEPLEIKKYCLKHNLSYIETSAISGDNIRKLLEYIVDLC